MKNTGHEFIVTAALIVGLGGAMASAQGTAAAGPSVKPAAVAKRAATPPPADATKAKSVGKTAAKATTANHASDDDSFWIEQIDIDGDGSVEDPDNYYVARANALEGNVVAYKVEAGKRADLKPRGSGLLAYGKKARMAAGAWGLLRVVARGSVFEVYLGADKLMEVEDSTFAAPGKVGLWTKADSVTWFDDFRVEVR